jgi:hypothetical protein
MDHHFRRFVTPELAVNLPSQQSKSLPNTRIFAKLLQARAFLRYRLVCFINSRFFFFTLMIVVYKSGAARYLLSTKQNHHGQQSVKAKTG